MEDKQIGLLMFGILGGLGFILLLIGIFLKRRKENRLDRCTRKTTGEVIGFTIPGNGAALPIVQYEVGDSSYKGKLIYRWTVIKRSTLTKKTEILSDDIFGHTLSIKTNSRLSTNALDSVLPKGTVLDVYYNPRQPKENYIQRRPKSLVPDIFSWIGIVFIVLGALIYYLFSQLVS